MSKLYFFRHAQASYGAANYDKLSPKGEQQAELLGQFLVEKDYVFDRIYIGPLVRQRHTYEIVADCFQKVNRSIPSPTLVQELIEHQGPKGLKMILPQLSKTNPQIGQWTAEIQANPTLKRRNGLLIFQYFMEEWSKGNIHIEGIQTWKDFRTSTKQGLQQILNKTQKGETIAAFTSGGTISTITAEGLNLQDDERIAALNYAVRNTAITSFIYSQQKFNLLAFNEIPHLPKEMITFV